MCRQYTLLDQGDLKHFLDHWYIKKLRAALTTDPWRTPHFNSSKLVLVVGSNSIYCFFFERKLLSNCGYYLLHLVTVFHPIVVVTSHTSYTLLPLSIQLRFIPLIPHCLLNCLFVVALQPWDDWTLSLKRDHQVFFLKILISSLNMKIKGWNL